MANNAKRNSKSPKRGTSERREAKDDVRQADESGEPRRAGRSHGHLIAKDGTMAGGEGQPCNNEHWESGRHDATK